ncbi:hypothetical protein N0609_11675 [Pseudomonas aeruginosa]|jgi:hypothetical protein|uniref:DUF7740 domain-containing protein n=1 Tax=Pseudomonas putida TaxID=303 RepID=A0A1L7NMI9_PSEPU|nr:MULTISPECIES: hypothetical protein [Pseudomonas]MCS7526963.1 hypothetical protein [Pseudomonas aeruginosa]MCS8510349.1 hypothetical protein [Pseudomonas aeruginosa]MCS8541143.1 hypothetical protein [Pseudomonas aeruginosa]MCT0600289.1 hypothetical protein [Pseudomonas aeruginosa]MCV4061301.1 hypothetical protein [Pseudomonas aeruginosa]
MLAAMNAPIPVKRVCLLTAITAMALAARIHGTDKAVMMTGYRVLAGLSPTYQPVVLAIMNAPSPLAHMNLYVANLPQHILEMKISKPALPLLDAAIPA